MTLPGRGTTLWFTLTALWVVALDRCVATDPTYRALTTVVDGRMGALTEHTRTGAPSVIVVGNSYVHNAVAAPTTPDRFKLVVKGMTLQTAVPLVEHLPTDGRVRGVALGLAYVYAGAGAEDTVVYDPWLASNPVAQAWSSLSFVRAGKLGPTLLRNRVESWVHPAEPEEEDPVAGTAPNPAALARSIRQRSRELAPFVVTPTPAFAAWVRRLGVWSASHHIPVWLFTPPIHPEVAATVPPSTLAAMRTEVRAAGLTWDEGNAHVAWTDPVAWSDATHVSARAQPLTTAWVEWGVQKMLGEGVGPNPLDGATP